MGSVIPTTATAKAKAVPFYYNWFRILKLDLTLPVSAPDQSILTFRWAVVKSGMRIPVWAQ